MNLFGNYFSIWLAGCFRQLTSISISFWASLTYSVTWRVRFRSSQMRLDLLAMIATTMSLMSWCWRLSEWLEPFLAFVWLEMRWCHRLDGAAPNPCVDRTIRNSELSCSPSMFHLLFVRSSNKPVDGKMFVLYILSHIVHPYIRSGGLVLTVDPIARTVYLAVNLFHLYSFLRNHINGTRFCGSNRSLNL